MAYTEKRRRSNFRSFGKGKSRNDESTSFENRPKEPESQEPETSDTEDT